MLELQPFAWRFHNTSFDAGLQTFREFVEVNDYVAVTLPRPSKMELQRAAQLDWCGLRPSATARPEPKADGLETAVALEWPGLVYLLQRTLQVRHFYEVLLTRRATLRKRWQRLRCAERRSKP